MKSATPKLTGQQLMFCREYVATKDLNGTKAAIRAGYSQKTARVQASHLLTKANIKEEIKRLMQDRIQRVQITGDIVLERLYKLGFYDVRKLFDKNGNMVPIRELDDETAAAVIGFKAAPSRRIRGRKVSGRLQSVRLANPKDSLELLGRHLGLFKDRLVIEKDEFDGKSAEELEYFATHGEWPDKPGGEASTPEGKSGSEATGN